MSRIPVCHLLSALLVLAVAYPPLEAQEVPAIKVVTEESFPINYTDDTSQKMTGFATDYLLTVLNQADVNYALNSYTWERSFKIASEEPNVLIYSMARTPERENDFHWLFEIMTLQYSLYGVESRREHFQGAKDFRSYQIALTAGSASLKYLKEDGYNNIVVAKDYEHLDNLLKHGRVDFVASSKLALSSFIKKYNYDKDTFSPYKELNYVDIDLYYAMSKSTDKQLVETLKTLFEEHKSHLQLP